MARVGTSGSDGVEVETLLCIHVWKDGPVCESSDLRGLDTRLFRSGVGRADNTDRTFRVVQGSPCGDTVTPYSGSPTLGSVGATVRVPDHTVGATPVRSVRPVSGQTVRRHIGTSAKTTGTDLHRRHTFTGVR